MARALVLLGTHSSADKSLMATTFCRILACRDIRVAPFKSQTMSNNAGVTIEGGEMGRAQIVQAEAAGIPPHTDMNPILLKPERNRSQIVLNGAVFGHLEAGNWMDIKRLLWDEVRAAYGRLAARFDATAMEGGRQPGRDQPEIGRRRRRGWLHSPTAAEPAPPAPAAWGSDSALRPSLSSRRCGISAQRQNPEKSRKNRPDKKAPPALSGGAFVTFLNRSTRRSTISSCCPEITAANSQSKST